MCTLSYCEEVGNVQSSVVSKTNITGLFPKEIRSLKEDTDSKPKK